MSHRCSGVSSSRLGKDPALIAHPTLAKDDWNREGAKRREGNEGTTKTQRAQRKYPLLAISVRSVRSVVQSSLLFASLRVFAVQFVPRPNPPSTSSAGRGSSSRAS